MRTNRAALRAPDVSTELTAKYFRALGDPTRLRILELLIEGPMTVTDLAHALRSSQSGISNHLACLRWCGFVSSRADGRWTYYSVTDRKLRRLMELGRELVGVRAQHVAACTRIG